MKAKFLLGAVVSVLGVATACQSPPSGGSSPPVTSGAAASGAAAATAATSVGPVATVVFIGQREACECTRNRIDTTWAALEQVLAKHPGLELKKLEQDVQQQEADRYDELEPLMVAPGVYLVDAQGKLVKMLQGELTVAELERALGGPSTPGS